MPPELKDTDIDTLIIGMGPAGLSQAYYNLKKGQKVLLVDMREDPFERDRTISLHSTFVELLLKDFTHFTENGWKIAYGDPYLEGDWGINLVNPRTGQSLSKMLGELPEKPTDTELENLAIEIGVTLVELKFFKLLIDNKRTVAINDIQKFLLDKISDLKDEHPEFADKITVATGTKVERDPGVGVKLTGKADVEIIKPTNVIVTSGSPSLSSNITIERALKEGPPLELQFLGAEYERKPLSKTHDHDMSAVIKIKCPENFKQALIEQGIDAKKINEILQKLVAPMIRFSNMRKQDIPGLQKLGWDESRLPEFFIQYHEDKHGQGIFYLAGEIPDAWKDNLDAKKIMEYSLAVLKIEYPELAGLIDAQKAEFKFENEKAPADSFMVEPTYLPEAYTEVDGMNVFFSGDTLISSNFYLGHGFEKAIKLSGAIADCFDENGKFKNATPLEKLFEELKRDYEVQLRNFRTATWTRENPLQGEALLHALYHLEEANKFKQAVGRKLADARQGMLFTPRKTPTKLSTPATTSQDHQVEVEQGPHSADSDKGSRPGSRNSLQ